MHLFQMKLKVKLLSRVQLFATPWTVAYQAPLSMGFSRQEYWSGLPFPSPGDLAGRFFTSSTIWEAVMSLFKATSQGLGAIGDNVFTVAASTRGKQYRKKSRLLTE